MLAAVTSPPNTAGSRQGDGADGRGGADARGGVQVVQRRGLLPGELVDDGDGHLGDQVRRHLDPVHLAKGRPDVPHTALVVAGEPGIIGLPGGT